MRYNSRRRRRVERGDELVAAMDEIALIEELAANAVPAAVVQELDGWRLRFNFGVTRRASSVLAVREGRLPLAERLALAEAFYERRGAPARFQLCPASQPSGLDGLLADRGYSLDGAPTNVQVAPLAAAMAGPAGVARVVERFDEPWLRAYCASEGVSDPLKIAARRTMLERVGPASGFAAVEADGELAAVAFGVVERGWLGLFNVATRPEFRRRGLGLAVLAGLAGWAAGHGAHSCYLQVMSSNTAAGALYARLGFVTRYNYWYRIRPPDSTTSVLGPDSTAAAERREGLRCRYTSLLLTRETQWDGSPPTPSTPPTGGRPLACESSCTGLPPTARPG